MIKDTGQTYLYGEIKKEVEEEEDTKVYTSDTPIYGELLDKATTVDGETTSQTFLYGEICARVEKFYYHGSKTKTAETIVDQSTIYVNVDNDYIASLVNQFVLSLGLTEKVKIQISTETNRATAVEADLQRQIDELKAQIQGGN